ncbi:unnamed protein product, partial [Dovyalis caffra]
VDNSNIQLDHITDELCFESIIKSCVNCLIPSIRLEDRKLARNHETIALGTMQHGTMI